MDTRPDIHLQRLLPMLPTPSSWPQGVSTMAFDPKRHAAEIHALLDHAYRKGGGVVPPFKIWWRGLRGDACYDPMLVFLAVDQGGVVIGVAQCWTSAFVKDLAVTEHWRRRGVGEALLTQVFAAFRTRGAGHVDLKVEADNAVALRLYDRLRMHSVAPRSIGMSG